MVSIPKGAWSAELILDQALKKTALPEQIMYGEKLTIFESRHSLQAYLEDRSYLEISPDVDCDSTPKELLLLITVEGPRSSNPSARVQLAALYKGISIKLKKRPFLPSRRYLDISFRKISIIAGDHQIGVSQSK